MPRKSYGKGLPLVRASRIYVGEKTTTLGLTPKNIFALADRLLEAAEDRNVQEDQVVEITTFRHTGKVTVSCDGRRAR